MTIKHYMKPDSNTPPAYVYVVGEDTDILWDPKICIEVEPRPTQDYDYNFETKTWELNEEKYMADLRFQRDGELNRTDKYVLEDFPFTPNDRIVTMQYREDLRECPDKSDIKDRAMPPCPPICKKQIRENK